MFEDYFCKRMEKIVALPAFPQENNVPPDSCTRSVLVYESPQEDAPCISIKLNQETICSHSDLFYYYSKGDYSC